MLKHVTVAAPLVCLALAAAWLAAAEPNAPEAQAEWNGWLGPARNGFTGGGGPPLLESWTAVPKKLWQSAEKITVGGGSGHSSPVVVKGKVYIHAGDTVICLDAADGKTLWKTQHSVEGWGASSTPLVTGGKVYAVISGVCCFDADTGKKLWSTPSIGGDVNASPLVAYGVVVA
jgi:outer membrane protein assembly factor BamB